MPEPAALLTAAVLAALDSTSANASFQRYPDPSSAEQCQRRAQFASLSRTLACLVNEHLVEAVAVECGGRYFGVASSEHADHSVGSSTSAPRDCAAESIIFELLYRPLSTRASAVAGATAATTAAAAGSSDAISWIDPSELTHKIVCVSNDHRVVPITSSAELISIFGRWTGIESALIESICDDTSLLIVGPRGSGKSALINRVLADLDADSTLTKAIVVKLNGMVHVDERQAVLDIARQLLSASVHASTQILDNADGEGEAVTAADYIERLPTMSFVQAIDLLVSLLRQGSRTASAPLLFILDEFDIFAQFPKQTLLYTLLDVAASSASGQGKSPIAVVGLTCRLDAVELLEKRVKSRFSHRQIMVNLPLTFEQYVEIAKQALTVPLDDKFGNVELYDNAVVEQTLSVNANTPLVRELRRLFDILRDVRLLHQLFVPAVASLHSYMNDPSSTGLETAVLSVQSVQSAIDNLLADQKTALLERLSLLELCLVVATKRLSDQGVAKFTFAMVYDEYRRFMLTQNTASFGMSSSGGGGGGGGGHLKLYNKNFAIKGFERLMDLELMTFADSTATGRAKSSTGATLAGAGSGAGGVAIPREFWQIRTMLTPGQVMDAVRAYPDVPQVIVRWVSSD
ncbi:hypothetical protein GQ42DRAFT_154667 [Ramicandelaber brevisporus]|nr:hypothetical protein GQ42DRAFT_154667 [Ramicandelaber brevisporus]